MEKNGRKADIKGEGLRDRVKRGIERKKGREGEEQKEK